MSEHTPGPTAEQQDQLADYLAGKLTPEQRRKLERKILDDPIQAESLFGQLGVQAILERQKTASQATSATRSPRRASRARLMKIALPLAAGIAMVLVLSPWKDRESVDAPSVFRSGNLNVEGYSPQGELDGVPGVFRWPGDIQVTRYRFELYDSQARLVHQTLVDATEYALPADVAAQLQPGEAFWKAIPLSERDVSEQEVPLVRFSVRRAGDGR